MMDGICVKGGFAPLTNSRTDHGYLMEEGNLAQTDYELEELLREGKGYRIKVFEAPDHVSVYLESQDKQMIQEIGTEILEENESLKDSDDPSSDRPPMPWLCDNSGEAMEIYGEHTLNSPKGITIEYFDCTTVLDEGNRYR